MSESVLPERRLNVPIPDPSIVTANRLIELRTLLETQIEKEVLALRQVIETRLHAMDSANKLMHEGLTRQPTETDQKVQHLKELHAARFDAVQHQFHERTVLAGVRDESVKNSLGAAMLTLRESAAALNVANTAAIAKSETNTSELIKGITQQIAAQAKTTDDKISSINARLDRGEGTGAGKKDQLATSLAVMAVVVSVALGIFNMMPHPATDPPYASSIAKFEALNSKVDALIARAK